MLEQNEASIRALQQPGQTLKPVKTERLQLTRLCWNVSSLSYALVTGTCTGGVMMN